MKYTNKIQTTRKKYLKRLPLTDQEQTLIAKDFSGKDFSFFKEENKLFILPERYDEEATFTLIEKRIGRNNRKPFIKYISYAAAIIIIALLSTVIYNYGTQSPVILYASTSYGEKKTIDLPDGTSIELNSLSSISYPMEMNGKARNVILEGEAYFDVAKDPNKAFIVRAGEIEVKVLGTKFNITAYENQENITTTLFEGAVSVGTNSRYTNRLEPGEQAIFSKKTERIETKTLTNPNIQSSWRKNILVFDNERLSDILNTLSRQYNIKFDIDNEQLEQLRITARFSSNESVENALAVLAKSAEFEYSKEGNIYKITRRE